MYVLLLRGKSFAYRISVHQDNFHGEFAHIINVILHMHLLIKVCIVVFRVLDMCSNIDLIFEFKGHSSIRFFCSSNFILILRILKPSY